MNSQGIIATKLFGSSNNEATGSHVKFHNCVLLKPISNWPAGTAFRSITVVPMKQLFLFETDQGTVSYKPGNWEQFRQAVMNGLELHGIQGTPQENQPGKVVAPTAPTGHVPGRLAPGKDTRQPVPIRLPGSPSNAPSPGDEVDRTKTAG